MDNMPEKSLESIIVCFFHFYTTTRTRVHNARDSVCILYNVNALKRIL